MHTIGPTWIRLFQKVSLFLKTQPSLERRQVCINAHPLGQEGSLRFKDLQEAGIRQGEVGQVDGAPPSELGGPDDEGAHGDDGVVTLLEEREVPGRRALLAVAREHHVPVGAVDVPPAPGPLPHAMPRSARREHCLHRILSLCLPVLMPRIHQPQLVRNYAFSAQQ